MTREIDPEVIADLRLREATKRERGRLREMPQWQPSPVIDRVPCRGRCGAVVDWTEDAEERFGIFNGILERRDEAPMDKTRIAFCSGCQTVGLQASADRNRKFVDTMGALIRELRGGTTHPAPPGPAPDADRERELLDKIKKLGHPDFDGLVQSLANSRNSKPAGRVTRGSL